MFIGGPIHSLAAPIVLAIDVERLERPEKARSVWRMRHAKRADLGRTSITDDSSEDGTTKALVCYGGEVRYI
jgi:hypothetical protein